MRINKLNYVLIFLGIVFLTNIGYSVPICGGIVSNNVTLGVDLSCTGTSGLIVDTENVTIDCNGHSIIGDDTESTYGIYSNVSNTTVINCNISHFDFGIYFQGAANGNISNNRFENNTVNGDCCGGGSAGIYLNEGSNNTQILYNNFTNNHIGFKVWYSNNNRIGYNFVNGSNLAGFGSCPLVYTWNGTGYEFTKDISGAGILGIKFQDGTYRRPTPGDYAKIDHLEAVNGTYNLQVTQEYDEISYLDELYLETIDHPTDVDVFTTLVRANLSSVYTVNKTQSSVVSCMDSYGADCLYEVESIDGNYTNGTSYDTNALIVDLGNLTGASNIKLVLDGFSEFGATAPSEKFIQVRAMDGSWINVYSGNQLGRPAGFPRTYVIDMSGKFPTDNYAVKIGFDSSRFDYVAVDTSEPAPITVTKIYPNYANLHKRGYSSTSQGVLPYPDYYNVSNTTTFLSPRGNFTKYGSVLSLLNKTADDKFVIMHHGDEISSEFPASSIPIGQERDFILYSWDYYKPHSYVYGSNVDPLPFKNMSNYPYRSDEQYPTDIDHQTYLYEWNTRKYTADLKAGGSFPHSDNNTIFNNTIFGAVAGLYFDVESNGSVLGNNISSGGRAVELYNAQNMIFDSNNFSGSDFDTMYLRELTNSTISSNYLESSTAGAIHLGYLTSNNSIFNNTLVTGGSDLFIVDSSASGNTLFWNNFTAAGTLFVNDVNGQNYYNGTTPFGTNEGNIWGDVISGNVQIGGNKHSTVFSDLYIGGSGDNYPYGDNTSLGKTLGVIDYAPLTPFKSFISETSNLSEYRMFGRHLNHDNWDGIDYPTTLIHQANYTTGAPIFSTPTVANGFIYVGSSDSILYQFNASNVSQLIASYVGGAFNTGIATANGFVYAGTVESTIYQLNASNVSQAIATYTGGNRMNSPAVANGYVYVGSNDGLLYQLNASDISQQVATFTTGGRISGTPAIANEFVYVGSADHKVYQLNASNLSQEIAHFTTNGLVSSSVAVWDGYVFIGSEDANVYQLNASNISGIWNDSSTFVASFDSGGPVYTSPSIVGGYLYIGSEGSNLYQLNASNISQLVASFYTGSFVESSPAVSDGFVYFGINNYALFQLNASNISGAYDDPASYVAVFGVGGAVVASPAVAKGYVYVGALDNNFYQLLASNISLPNPNVPAISFISPTPTDGSTQSITEIEINISSSDNTNYYTLNDFGHSLVLWLRMDEVDGSGNPIDSSSYGNLVTAGTPPEQTSNGMFGKGLDLSGENTLVLSRPVADDFTICSWVKTTASGNGPNHYEGVGIFQSETSDLANDFGLGIDWGGKIVFGVGGDADVSISGTVNVNDDTWHFVCASRNQSSGEMTIYADGEFDGSDIGSTISLDSNPTATIGLGTDGGEYLNGNIDDLTVFNRVLSPGEISSLYSATEKQYHNEFSDLSFGTYTFTGYAVNSVGQVNQTEERRVIIALPITETPSSGGSGSAHRFSVTQSSSCSENIVTVSSNNADEVSNLYVSVRDATISNKELTSCRTDSTGKCTYNTSNIGPVVLNILDIFYPNYPGSFSLASDCAPAETTNPTTPSVTDNGHPVAPSPPVNSTKPLPLISAPTSGTFGSSITISTKDCNLNCQVSVTAPDGTISTFTPNEVGNVIITLSQTGNYIISLISDGSTITVLNVVSASAPPTSVSSAPSAVPINPQSNSDGGLWLIGGVILIFIVTCGAIYWYMNWKK